MGNFGCLSVNETIKVVRQARRYYVNGIIEARYEGNEDESYTKNSYGMYQALKVLGVTPAGIQAAVKYCRDRRFRYLRLGAHGRHVRNIRKYPFIETF